MNSAEDHLLSTMVVAIMAVLGWNVVSSHDRRPADRPGPTIDVMETSAELEDRVAAIAEAIALAEGYYVRGEHDGRSLLYRLNNPGGLKKPALGAETLPTWLDTGLVIFPTSDMGWAALRHQVRMMLTGKSRIYHPSDTLVHVGLKYADGDANWGNERSRQPPRVSRRATRGTGGVPAPAVTMAFEAK